MKSSRIPEDVNKYRPGPCTEIKLIGGHYYVYMYNAVQLPSGKWGKKTGKSIGKIIPGTGFIPNKNQCQQLSSGMVSVVKIQH